MAQRKTGVIAMTACATFSALMTVQAMAQPALGVSPSGGGAGALGTALSGDFVAANAGGDFASLRTVAEQQDGQASSEDGASPAQTLPGLASASDDGDAQPNRFDGGVTVRQETRGESFTPGEGDLAEVRNPSFFERHTVAEDHSSVRTCLAAGEVCRAEFDVIVATSEDSYYDTAVLVNDEKVLPPEDG